MKTVALFFTLTFLLFQNLKGQNSNGSLNGILLDSASNQPLQLATITIFTAVDTSIVSYKLSNLKGEFNVSGLPIDIQLRVLITMSGYKVFRKEFMLSAGNLSKSLGQISIPKDTTSLDEVIVISERPPVLYRKDTIEFNASSFKLLPSALVEDLLKKLPGVEVSRNGDITVNGKPVNRILVDGKEFFGRDIRLATRNLPANIIDKVEVVDDEEQRLRNLSSHPNDIGKVVNLKLKKYIKKGWFGKSYFGGGTNDRYESGAMLNSFRDTLQISLLFYANNINKSAFTSSDILSVGGFSRNFFHDLNIDSKGNVQSIDGLSFGGNNHGIESTLGTGININNEISKKTSVNFQYFLGQSRTDLKRSSYSTQFINDTSLNTNIEFMSQNKGISHQFGGSFRSKINSNSKFTFSPILIISNGNQKSVDSTLSNTNTTPILNKSLILGTYDARSVNYNQEIIYETKKSNIRSFSVVNNSKIYSNKSSLYNNSNSLYFTDTGVLNYIVDQLRKVISKGFSTVSNINYQRKLSSSIVFKNSSKFDYSKGNLEITIFGKTSSTGNYDSLNSMLSDSLILERFRGNTSFFFDKSFSRSTVLSFGVNAQLINLNSTRNNDKLKRNYAYIFPYFKARFKEFTFSYTPRVVEPSINDLQPVLDNTNPLFERVGNINLKPTVSHTLYFGKTKFNPVNNLLYVYSIEPFLTANDLSFSKQVNEKGVQTLTPINVKGSKGINTYLLVSKRYKLKKNSQLNLQFNNRAIYTKKTTLINNNAKSGDIDHLKPV